MDASIDTVDLEKAKKDWWMDMAGNSEAESLLKEIFFDLVEKGDLQATPNIPSRWHYNSANPMQRLKAAGMVKENMRLTNKAIGLILDRFGKEQ